MDLSKPYSAIIPSLDGPVLNVLYRSSRPFTGAEVSRLLPKGSQRGVRLVLDRMSAHGLVHKERAGGAWIYSLNRSHIAFEAVADIMELRSSLFKQMGRNIAAWRIKPDHASVFGSAASGEGGVTSDIDVFLLRPDTVAEEDSGWRNQLQTFRSDVAALTGNHVSLIEASWTDLKSMLKRRPRVVDSLCDDSITLFGPDFRNLGIRLMARSTNN